MNKQLLTKFRVGIYGVLIEHGKVLLTDTKVPSGVITNFPGGGLQLGESPVEALTREFIEETGVSVRVEELLFSSRTFHQNLEYPHEQVIQMYYRVFRNGGAIDMAGNGDDVVGAAWFTPPELASRRILAPDREFIDHASFMRLFEIY